MSWETVIGLEVHVQLATRTKLFCGCELGFGLEPNTRTCPVCTGQPGALPVLNGEAVALATRTALAVGATIHPRSVFARKNYHYVDLPKAYQISQFEEPYCTGGAIPTSTGGAELERIHLEEDAGKTIHDRGPYSLVDLNRAGTPLIEVVGLPTLRSEEEAVDAVRSLRDLVRWIGASRADMEKGELRCDVNVSVRQPGAALGTKVEVKNLNSFRHIEAAIEHERARQIACLEGFETIVQETRLFDPASGTTRSMRTKEDADDYRYFPDPDLPPLVIYPADLSREEGLLPELPAARRDRFQSEHGLSEYDAGVLTADRDLSDWFEALLRSGASAKAAANWLTNEVQAALSDDDIPARSIDELPFTPRDLAALLELIGQGKLSSRSARDLFAHLVRHGGDPRALIDELGLAQVDDAGAIEAWCREAIEAKPDAAEAVTAGNDKALGALVGPAMKASAGRAEPGKIKETLLRLLR